jgi:radical SAM superfamily enzyme YgiQ (UPF0313 family)
MVDYQNETASAKIIKKRFPGIKIGFIGAFCGIKPELFLPSCDFVINGEPEKAVMEISQTGIIPAGIVDSAMIDNLDTLPFPEWSLFSFKKFRYMPYFPKFRHGKNFFPVLSSRSCPYSCKYYCPYTIVTHGKYRARSPENVISELEELVSKYNAMLILFRDPTFTINRERIITICNGILQKRLKIEFVCETHTKNLDKELVDIMFEAGLKAVKIGVESADASMLNNFNRQNDKLQHQEDIIAYCEKIGIAVTAFYILGLKDDTEKSIVRTIDYAKKLNTIGAQFTIATPYPGTKFYDDMEKEGLLLTKDYQKYDIHTPVFKHPSLSPETLLQLKNYAYQSYYMRPTWIYKFIKMKLLK